MDGEVIHSRSNTDEQANNQLKDRELFSELAFLSDLREIFLNNTGRGNRNNSGNILFNLRELVKLTSELFRTFRGNESNSIFRIID